MHQSGDPASHCPLAFLRYLRFLLFKNNSTFRRSNSSPFWLSALRLSLISSGAPVMFFFC